MDWFKSYTSIILYTHTHNMKYTLNKDMYVFGQDAYKRLHLIKENIFWDGSYNHWKGSKKSPPHKGKLFGESN